MDYIVLDEGTCAQVDIRDSDDLIAEDLRDSLCNFHTTICKSKPYVSGSEALSIYTPKSDRTCIGTVFVDQMITTHATMQFGAVPVGCG